jgi:hypothetical protein
LNLASKEAEISISFGAAWSDFDVILLVLNLEGAIVAIVER